MTPDELKALPYPELLAYLQARYPYLRSAVFPITVQTDGRGRVTLAANGVVTWSGPAHEHLAQVPEVVERPGVIPLDAAGTPLPSVPGAPSELLPPLDGRLAQAIEDENLTQLRQQAGIAVTPDEMLALEEARKDRSIERPASVEELKTKNPSLWTKALSLAKAAKAAASTLVSTGRVLAPVETVNARRMTCRGCPQFTPQGTCGDLVEVSSGKVAKKGCGCNMRAKTTLAASSCPSGHWGPWVPDTVAASPV